MKTQAQLNAIAVKVVNTYKSKSQIKRMELTIKDVYSLDTVEFKAVKKAAFDCKAVPVQLRKTNKKPLRVLWLTVR